MKVSVIVATYYDQDTGMEPRYWFCVLRPFLVNENE